MKRVIMLFLSLVLLSIVVLAQDSRRDKRRTRDREKSEEIQKLIDQGNLRFIANFAHPMSGGSIHLTSEYTLDIEDGKVTAYLPFFGRAYSVDYGAMDGGIKFSEMASSLTWEKEKKGNRAVMEVKTNRDAFQVQLSVTPLGYASLNVISNNRQPIRFSGIVVKISKEDGGT